MLVRRTRDWRITNITVQYGSAAGDGNSGRRRNETWEDANRAYVLM
jgi:hypothetical protein